MGEVWRGRDTRLDRSVAIKILPAEFAQNAQFKLRFEREAKTISQLSHPNICTLYDVGENYLVMELLDGESLADKSRRDRCRSSRSCATAFRLPTRSTRRIARASCIAI
jgi:serine/threonine protein kinase